ncbi:MAG: hypothetical protein M0Z58_05260 [Nitrospiraceae bacterium]|nr:hypothetical protein [Nitrospiraceae bacterium]MDA8388058.1 hypothetical protein [Nitrospiraceae bacterium]
MKKAGLMLVIFSLCVFVPLVAMAASADWIGQVYPAGNAQALLKGGQWLNVGGVYPVPEEGSFRTAKGGLSFSFKDGTQMDMGANSEVSLKRLSNGKVAVSLRKGAIGINSPAGGRVVIVTPEGLGYEPGPKGFTGGFSFDGAKTRTKTLAGNIGPVKDKETLASLKEVPSLRQEAADPPPLAPAIIPGAFAGTGGSAGPLTGLLVGGGFGGLAGGGVATEESRGPSHASAFTP